MAGYLKKPWFTGIHAGFQAGFTANLLLLRERALLQAALRARFCRGEGFYLNPKNHRPIA